MLVNAIVLINVQRSSVKEVAQGLLNIEGVDEVFSVAGRFDLVAILRVGSNEAVADIVTQAIQELPGITDTETLLAFRTYDRDDLEKAFSIGNDE